MIMEMLQIMLKQSRYIYTHLCIYGLIRWFLQYEATIGRSLPSSQASILRLGHSFRVTWSGAKSVAQKKNPKSETICLTFSPCRFRLAVGNSLSISGRGTAREKHFKPLACGLMLSGQVKSLFGSKPTFIDSVSSQKQLDAFSLLSTGKY